MQPVWAYSYLLAIVGTGVPAVVLLARWTDIRPIACVAVGFALAVATGLVGRHLALAWWHSRPALVHPESSTCQREPVRYDPRTDALAVFEPCSQGPTVARVHVICGSCTQVESASWCQACVDRARHPSRLRCTSCGQRVLDVLTDVASR